MTALASAASGQVTPAWLTVAGLEWHCPGRQILCDVAFRVATGQVVGLLGANGSGKSSALRAVLGLIAAKASRVELNGEPSTLGAADLRAQIGVVQQAPSVDGKLTVAENVRLGGLLYGLRGRAVAEAVAIALAHSGLADRAAERVERLSGGLRRRLELARSLCHAPTALLLDEPTQGLDAAAKETFWQRVLAARQARSLSVLLATHDPAEAARCDVLYLLREGRVVRHGSVASLLADMSADVVEVRGPSLAAVNKVTEPWGLVASVDDTGLVRLPCRDGHLLIPSLVGALGPKHITAVQLRRASLADVFLTLTGQALPSAAPAAASSPLQGASRGR